MLGRPGKRDKRKKNNNTLLLLLLRDVHAQERERKLGTARGSPWEHARRRRGRNRGAEVTGRAEAAAVLAGALQVDGGAMGSFHGSTLAAAAPVILKTRDEAHEIARD